MFKETKQDILMEAALVRQACDRYANHYSGIFWDGLGGMCGMASHYLFRKLTERGYKATFIRADSGTGMHCWVAVDDFNVDITATQFQKCMPVYSFVGKPKDHPIASRIASRGMDIFTGTSNADIIKLMTGWPENQSLTFTNRKIMDKFYES